MYANLQDFPYVTDSGQRAKVARNLWPFFKFERGERPRKPSFGMSGGPTLTVSLPARVGFLCRRMFSCNSGLDRSVGNC